MKLYMLSQDVNNDYDTYDSCVVAAESEEDARMIKPGSNQEWEHDLWSTWANNPKDVKVEYLGEAKEDTVSGVILASYNAG